MDPTAIAARQIPAVALVLACSLVDCFQSTEVEDAADVIPDVMHLRHVRHLPQAAAAMTLQTADAVNTDSRECSAGSVAWDAGLAEVNRLAIAQLTRCQAVVVRRLPIAGAATVVANTSVRIFHATVNPVAVAMSHAMVVAEAANLDCWITFEIIEPIVPQPVAPTIVVQRCIPIRDALIAETDVSMEMSYLRQP